MFGVGGVDISESRFSDWGSKLYVLQKGVAEAALNSIIEHLISTSKSCVIVGSVVLMQSRVGKSTGQSLQIAANFNPSDG